VDNMARNHRSITFLTINSYASWVDV